MSMRCLELRKPDCKHKVITMRGEKNKLQNKNNKTNKKQYTEDGVARL